MAETNDDTNTPEPRPSEQDAVSQISELFQQQLEGKSTEPQPDGDPAPAEIAEPSPDGDPAPTEPPGDDKPATLAQLAERAGMTEADVYALAVAMPNDEAMTFGEMKDKVGQAQELLAERESITEHREEFEREMVRARTELRQIMSLLPEIPEELVQQAAQQHAELLQSERGALLDVKPDWRDRAVFEQAQDDIMEIASEYGFTRTDLNAVVDHRLQLLLHNFATQTKRLRKAREDAQQLRRTTTPAKPQARTTQVGGDKAGERLNQLENAAKADGATNDDKKAAASALFQSALKK